MKNRIKQLMTEKGLTGETLAEKIGTHSVTISKLITGRMKLTTDWMDKLAEGLGVDPLEILEERRDLRIVTVKHAVQAGSWSQAIVWEDETAWYEVIVPNDTSLATKTLYGAQVVGTSMDKRYLDGTVLIYTSPWDDREDPQPGKRYIVERRKPDGLIEATVKLLHKAGDGKFWLLPESNDPLHQQPIPLDGLDDEIVSIVGRVRYSVSRE